MSQTKLRDRAKISAGQQVKVVMEPDAPEGSDLPEDLAQALAGDKKARAFLDSLSAFYRNTFIKSIVEAKKPETRAARVVKVVAALKEGKKQL